MGNMTFIQDLMATIYGDVDRGSIQTRTVKADGGLSLTRIG